MAKVKVSSNGAKSGNFNIYCMCFVRVGVENNSITTDPARVLFACCCINNSMEKHCAHVCVRKHKYTKAYLEYTHSHT